MKTIEEIYSGLKAEFESASGIRMNDGGDMALRFYAFAAQLASLWAQADYVNRQCFPHTAVGEALDMHAAMRGLERVAAAKAGGTLRFSIPSSSAAAIAVPVGTRCMTANGTEFVTTQAGSIAAGSLYCDVSAEAVQPGADGNAPAGSVAYMQQAPLGVRACTNTAAFTGGTDAEDDVSLRGRILESCRSLPNGGNAAYYEAAALSVPGIAAAKVLPRNRGRGTVDIIVAADDGMPTQQLVSAVSSAVGARREICVDVGVSGPTQVTVDITADIDVAAGYGSQAVKNEVEAKLSDYFSGRRLGKNVKLAELGNLIYSVEGVENYSISEPSADVSISTDELPVAGDILIRS